LLLAKIGVVAAVAMVVYTKDNHGGGMRSTTAHGGIELQTFVVMICRRRMMMMMDWCMDRIVTYQ